MLSSKYFLAVLTGIAAFITGLSAAHYLYPSPAIAEQAVTGTPSKDARELCERLIRFGRTAYTRGNFVEAKKFFQKAIAVYPENVAAWKQYNMSLFSLISARVETDPSFLPEEPPATAGHAPEKRPHSFPQTEAPEDGC